MTNYSRIVALQFKLSEGNLKGCSGKLFQHISTYFHNDRITEFKYTFNEQAKFATYSLYWFSNCLWTHGTSWSCMSNRWSSCINPATVFALQNIFFLWPHSFLNLSFWDLSSEIPNLIPNLFVLICDSKPRITLKDGFSVLHCLLSTTYALWHILFKIVWK